MRLETPAVNYSGPNALIRTGLSRKSGRIRIHFEGMPDHVRDIRRKNLEFCKAPTMLRESDAHRYCRHRCKSPRLDHAIRRSPSIRAVSALLQAEVQVSCFGSGFDSRKEFEDLCQQLNLQSGEGVHKRGEHTIFGTYTRSASKPLENLRLLPGHRLIQTPDIQPRIRAASERSSDKRRFPPANDPMMLIERFRFRKYVNVSPPGRMVPLRARPA